MPIALFAATMLGLYSKESALCIVPLVPLAALLTSQYTHPERPLRWARAAVAAVTAGVAFVFYVEMRRRWFHVETPHDLTAEANAGKSQLHRAFAAALRWYAQPMLPHDPLNNPLINASPEFRVAGALRVFARGIGQVLFPLTLSGDYSAPQEPIPDHLVFEGSVVGALAMVAPLVAAPVVGLVSWWRSRRASAAAQGVDFGPLVVFALVWAVVSFFPVSNIPVVLPTVRAERFWYFPRDRHRRRPRPRVLLALLAGPPRPRHACGDRPARPLPRLPVLRRAPATRWTTRTISSFWDATRKSVPRSAKAHLNYSVMLGARGDLVGRLASNDVALALAPEWPMASVYEGDTLCRLHRADEALPHYLRGFEKGPNDLSLIALGLQCLWDEKSITAEDAPARAPLQDLADRFPGSWLKYLVDDTFESGDEYQGVNPKYRPRGYNEGPKKDE